MSVHNALKMKSMVALCSRALLRQACLRAINSGSRASSTAAGSSDSSRPSFAPKPVIDVKAIRLQPDLYAENCRLRNYASQADDPAKIVELHEHWKVLQQHALALRKRNNQLRTQLSHSKTFSGIPDGEKGREGDKEAALEEARKLKEQLQAIEANESKLSEQIEELAIAQPNLTSSETPLGNEPKLLEYINEPDATRSAEKSSTDRMWKSHVHIGSELDLLDFTAAGSTSGWGWYYLKNEAALLEQALVQYATSIARENNFSIISPPSMVYSHIASACGFRPRDQGGEQQIYTIQPSPSSSSSSTSTSSPKPELSLSGTAEIPFAALKASTDLEESDLPLLISGSSRCYRAEAGSRGLSTKGLYRVHEFTKVEMFGWTAPDEAAATALFTRMVSIQKTILRSLGLHCRVLEQPATDLGASASRKQDIEAWFPSRQERDGGWGEVTSTSICTDYQSRRLGTRLRGAKGGAKTWPWTVNGTAMAVPRVLAAILETHWEEAEGRVKIPECLWPWMHGVREIRRKRSRPMDTHL